MYATVPQLGALGAFNAGAHTAALQSSIDCFVTSMQAIGPADARWGRIDPWSSVQYYGGPYAATPACPEHGIRFGCGPLICFSSSTAHTEAVRALILLGQQMWNAQGQPPYGGTAAALPVPGPAPADDPASQLPDAGEPAAPTGVAPPGGSQAYFPPTAPTLTHPASPLTSASPGEAEAVGLPREPVLYSPSGVEDDLQFSVRGAPTVTTEGEDVVELEGEYFPTGAPAAAGAAPPWLWLALGALLLAGHR